MSELPAKWRIFKALSIVQMVLVMLMLVISFGGVFYGDNIFWRLLEVVCYGLIMLFLYQGFTILNDNFPDTPLSVKQKRNFNRLFLANVLLIAFLFAKVVSQWRYVHGIVGGLTLDMRGHFLILLPLIIAVLVFILNIVHLAGMYRLRTLIHENNLRQIDEEFINDR